MNTVGLAPRPDCADVPCAPGAPCTVHHIPTALHLAAGNDGDWRIVSPEAVLTNEQAAAITFRADPERVRVGGFVEVIDPAGTRIGVVSTATLHEQAFGASYVVVGITLR